MGGPGSGRRPVQPVNATSQALGNSPLFERLLYPLARLGSPWQGYEGIAALVHSRPLAGEVGYQNYLVGCLKGEPPREVNVIFARYAATKDGWRPVLTTLGGQLVKYHQVGEGFGLCLVRLHDETPHRFTVVLADRQVWNRLAPLDKVWVAHASRGMPLAQPAYVQAVNCGDGQNYNLLLPEVVDEWNCHLVLGTGNGERTYLHALGGRRIQIASCELKEWANLTEEET